MDARDLIFKSPHLILLFCCTLAVVVLTFIKLLCITPLLLSLDLIGLSGRGADTVSMGFWVGNCSKGSIEKRVRLQLCNSELSWFRSNKLGHVSRYESGSFQSGMNAVSPNQTRFSPGGLPVLYKANIIIGTPPRQPAVEL